MDDGWTMDAPLLRMPSPSLSAGPDTKKACGAVKHARARGAVPKQAWAGPATGSSSCAPPPITSHAPAPQAALALHSRHQYNGTESLAVGVVRRPPVHAATHPPAPQCSPPPLCPHTQAAGDPMRGALCPGTAVPTAQILAQHPAPHCAMDAGASELRRTRLTQPPPLPLPRRAKGSPASAERTGLRTGLGRTAAQAFL